MTNVIVVGLLVLTPILACKSFSPDGTPPPPGQEIVLTTRSEVIANTPETELAPISLEIVPDEVEKVLGASEANPVVSTARENVLPTSTKFIQVEGVDLTSEEGWLEWLTTPGVAATLTNILNGIPGAAPYILGLEAILALLFARKRQNYGNAAKSLVTGHVTEALSSAAKGLGVKHTNAQ